MISFFIPIRKGSKRVINKNTRKINGYKFGLTEIKILQLNNLRKFFLRSNKSYLKNVDFTISTDCKKIKKIAKKFKWIKIHNRNKKLSADDCLDQLILEVPKICKNKFILWTHVTSPCFNTSDYLKFIEVFFKIHKKKGKNSAFSADLVKKFLLDENYRWISHDFKKKKWPRTQDLNRLYQVNSAVFLSERKNYINLGDRLGKKPFPIISRYGSSFDIDDKQDFSFFESMIKRIDIK